MRFIVQLVLTGILLGVAAGGLLRAQAYVNEQAERYVARVEVSERQLASKSRGALEEGHRAAREPASRPTAEIARSSEQSGDNGSVAVLAAAANSVAVAAGAAIAAKPIEQPGRTSRRGRARRMAVVGAVPATGKSAVAEPEVADRGDKERVRSVRVYRPGGGTSVYTVPRE